MPKRVLLCDDEVHILRPAQFKFQRCGFDVTLASDGQAAWELVQKEQFDAIVTDCQMPRMNGLELVEKLRSYEPTKNVPVIMLTAKGFELSAAELREKWNVAELLAKPFSPKLLVQKVEELLGCTAESK